MIKCQMMRWSGHAYKILVGKPEGITLEIRRRREDNIKMDLKAIRWKGVQLAQDRDRCCEHGDEPSGSVKCEEFLNQLNNY
jgi:hypothetical protein